jgi:hypothetical protein
VGLCAERCTTFARLDHRLLALFGFDVVERTSLRVEFLQQGREGANGSRGVAE